MKLDVVIDGDTAEDFDYSSSIDSQTYNKIKLVDDKQQVVIAQDAVCFNQWGVLQYFEKVQSGENARAKAEALLKLYNKKTRNLKLNHCMGDIRCRAGMLVLVRLNLGDLVTSNYMLVEKATHNFQKDQHLMSLVLRGGEFVV